MSDDPFVTYRRLLFTVAYEMLGSAADAEDVVQEAWLRWADTDRAAVREATIGDAIPSTQTLVRRPSPRSSPRNGSSA